MSYIYIYIYIYLFILFFFFLKMNSFEFKLVEHNINYEFKSFFNCWFNNRMLFFLLNKIFKTFDFIYLTKNILLKSVKIIFFWGNQSM